MEQKIKRKKIRKPRSEVARQLPVGSLARAQVIRNAEKKAKAECPNAFRNEDSYGQ